MIKAIILAAGKGTRLKPLSDHVTKAMMPVANVPITERLIDQIAIETGANEFVVLASGPEQDIVSHLSAKKDLNIRFAFQSEQLGTGHAVKTVLDDYPMDTPFLLAACDNLYPPGEIGRLVDSFKKDDKDACLALLEMSADQMARSATVRIEGNLITEIIEKPLPEEILSPFASLSMYVLRPEISGYLDKIGTSNRGEIELQDAFKMWMSNGARFGFHVVSNRDTITTIEDLVRLNSRYARSAAMSREPEWDEVILVEPILAGENSHVGAGSVIGPDVVIGERAKIGHDCLVKNAVVFANAVIQDGTVAENGCWYGKEFFPA